MESNIAILFDLDGTLIDSAFDIATAANGMLGQLDLPAVSLDQVRLWIGEGVERMVHRCITTEIDGIADEHLVREGTKHFRAAYLATDFADTRMLDGALDLLTALRAAGYPIGLVTNKPEIPTRGVLEKFQLGPYFDAVVCGDTLETSKPHPLPLQHALLGCGATSGWMVGDSETDAASSGAAGLPFIAIRGGYGQEADPDRFSVRPALVIESLRDLLDFEGIPLEMLARPSAFS